MTNVSSLISAEARVELEKLLANLKAPVKITLFTQSNPCPTCSEQRKLLEEVASMTPKISLTILDLVKDQALASGG